MPLEYIRWALAEKFHWTLDEVDSLSLSDLAEFFEVEAGKAKTRGGD